MRSSDLTRSISSGHRRVNKNRCHQKKHTRKQATMSDQNKNHLGWLHTFASLNWYEETIKFIFNFVTKTSELLLAAGIIISTANFLTDGDIMIHNKPLSDAWSWAQALAI